MGSDVVQDAIICTQFCCLCFWNPEYWSKRSYMEYYMNGILNEKGEDEMKFTIQDDVLEVKTLYRALRGNIGLQAVNVKFYRTIQKPYIQDIQLISSVKDNGDGTGTPIRFTQKVQATIIEHSNDKIVLKVDLFDVSQNIYNSQKWSNIVELVNEDQNWDLFGYRLNYYEYEIVARFEYSSKMPTPDSD